MAAINPEVSEAMSLVLRGDAVGSTTYSQRYILRILIKLTKFIQGQEEFNSEFETELCTLWDMCAEKDVVVFLKRHGIVSLCVNTLRTSENPRLTEIIVGIIGNMCSCGRVRKECRHRADLVEIMMELLSFPDTPTLIQVMRVLQTFAWEISNTVEPTSRIKKKRRTGISNNCYDFQNQKDFEMDTCAQKSNRQQIVNPFYCDNTDDEMMSEDDRRFITSESSSMSDCDDVEQLSVKVIDSNDRESDSDIQLIKEINTDKIAGISEENCITVTRVNKESFIKDDNVKFIKDLGIIKKNKNNQNGSEQENRETKNISLEASESAQNKFCTKELADEKSTADNETEYNDVIFGKILVVRESDSSLAENKYVIGSGDCNKTCEPLNPAENSTLLTGLPVGEADSPGKSNASETLDCVDNIVSGGDSGNNNGADLAAHCSSVKEIGTIADNQIDVPKVVPVVGRDAMLSGSSALVWYEQFLNVHCWMPGMIFILGSSKDRELIKLTWTLLSTLSYIDMRDTRDRFLFSQMATPELLKVLVESYHEYFGHHLASDSVCVPECRAALIQWTKMIYSFCFSEDTVNMYGLYKANIMKIIFEMFRVFENFLPIDGSLLDYLTHTFSVLNCLLQIKPLELQILEDGVEKTELLLDIIQAEKIRKLSDNKSSRKEVNAIEQGDKFLRNVLLLCNYLESTGCIENLEETCQRLKERFVRRNDL